MDNIKTTQWCDQHCHLTYTHEANERRTKIVIVLTAVVMVIEITAGIAYGSMALLADGWHMASHASALSITALAYYFARRYSADPNFSFGTGKIGDLAGFSSALLLAFIALLMGYESILRFLTPVVISFNEAILVAVIGLIVNLLSAFILKENHHHESRPHQHEDHNLKAAYLHVLADALTSILAIFSLLVGKYFNWIWMDPLMGLVGAFIIAKWSYGLMKETGKILLDMNLNKELVDDIRQTIESSGHDQLNDIHVWRTAPGYYFAILSLTSQKSFSPDHYKRILKHYPELKHVTVEVRQAD
jgi:cation diffusion facilitator family transporter